MKIAFHVAFGIHLLSILGVLVLLVSVPGLGSLLLGVGPTDCDLLVWGDGGKLE